MGRKKKQPEDKLKQVTISISNRYVMQHGLDKITKELTPVVREYVTKIK